MRLTELLGDVGRPLAYYPALTPLTGAVTATILLCQLIYWTGSQHDAEGWIYKKLPELREETGLSRHELERARRELRDRGFVEEAVRGVPPTVHFRIVAEAIDTAWERHQAIIRNSDN